MSNRNISNNDDIIDSRDIIERISELENDLGLPHAETEIESFNAWLKLQADNDESLHQDNARELLSLLKLQEQCEDYAEDWKYGVSLIRDSYFKEYARQLAEDIGDIKGNERWPFNCIDWDEAAEQLQMDYTSVDFDGVTYWIR